MRMLSTENSYWYSSSSSDLKVPIKIRVNIELSAETEKSVCCREVDVSETRVLIGPLHDPVTWYGINYAGTQITQWEFENKGTLTIPARLSFVLKVPLRYLRPSIIYSLLCDWIVQRAYYSVVRKKNKLEWLCESSFFTILQRHFTS